MRPSPLVVALDIDHDGSLSAAEIAGAPAALRTLDQNGDGTLAMDEVRPARPDAAPSANDDLVNTLFAFDENKDGKLSKAEVPERMQGIFARADADQDGYLTRAELTQASATQERAQGGGPGGPPDPVFRALDHDQDGSLSPAEIAAAPKALLALDRNSDGMLDQQELRPMRGGPGGMGDPRQMIEHLFEENDANHDGKLSKAEVPERMQDIFARADADQDGFLTKDELAKAFERMGGRRQ